MEGAVLPMLPHEEPPTAAACQTCSHRDENEPEGYGRKAGCARFFPHSCAHMKGIHTQEFPHIHSCSLPHSLP